MADIELVIKMSEEEYINIKDAINSLIENGVERASMSKVCLAILDGIPIPKGHGRVDDLKKECRYCCREIDASGLEGFRCTNRAVIKTTDSSWCRPKNANEPCSICEYCEPKQDMKMSIDDVELWAKQNNFTIVADNWWEAAQDIICKYQKIEDIYYHQSAEALENSLRSVIEDGNVD